MGRRIGSNFARHCEKLLAHPARETRRSRQRTGKDARQRAANDASASYEIFIAGRKWVPASRRSLEQSVAARAWRGNGKKLYLMIACKAGTISSIVFFSLRQETTTEIFMRFESPS